MPVSWQPYEAFDWAASQQSAMGEAEREDSVDFAAEVLGLGTDDRATAWGAASPPGRFAATVIRVSTGIEHRYRERAAEAGIREVAVKVFKTNDDAAREARRVVPFHRTQIHRLPGLPNAHVQKSLDAGLRRNRHGLEQAFVVQEWVDGDSLEDLIRRRWPVEPASTSVIRSILEQLLGSIVIPLWAKGTIWWDVRDANYCYAPATDRLTLIDVDSLAAYAEEILETPSVWQKRDKGRGTAGSRLKQMCTRLLLAQGGRGKKASETACANAWAAELAPVLAKLGKEPDEETRAREALGRFLAAVGFP